MSVGTGKRKVKNGGRLSAVRKPNADLLELILQVVNLGIEILNRVGATEGKMQRGGQWNSTLPVNHNHQQVIAPFRYKESVGLAGKSQQAERGENRPSVIWKEDRVSCVEWPGAW